jgi:glycosyltransferase involved in cell wall biosynthesis
MNKVTFAIPVAPHHTDLLPRALASIEAQTVESVAMYMIDHDGEGPGAIRNAILSAVKTPYVVFLDADDWVDPRFVEDTLAAISGGSYVYTDWWQDDKYIHAPEKPWCGGTWHVITTLLPTALVRAVGGFDEDLPALEDTDFYLKMTTSQHCGIHLKRPLFHYGREGRRAKGVHDDGSVQELREIIRERYLYQMGCCGEKPVESGEPIGSKQAGDVLAQAKWAGNRIEYSRLSGRRYPRMSRPRITWVARADIDARPDLWREIIEPAVTDEQRFVGLGGFAQILREHGQMGRAPDNGRPAPVVTVPDDFDRADIAPDFKGVIEIARGRLESDR